MSASAAAASSSSSPPTASTIDPAINASIERKLKRMRETVDDLHKQGADILAEIDRTDAHHKTKLKEHYQELQQHRKQIESEQHAWEETTAKARKISASAPRKVKLNVGGQTHMTTIDTLTSEKGTFFDAMFSEHFDTKPDADGEIFIDRNPRHFGLIVDHMRGIDISKRIAELSESDLDLLKQDVDYYQVESLARLLGMRKPTGKGWDLDETKQYRDIILTRNDDGSVHAKCNSSIYRPVLGSSGFSAGTHEWQVRVDEQYCLLGVCRLSDTSPYLQGQQSVQDAFEVAWGKDSRSYIYRHNTYSGYPRQGREWSKGTIVQVRLDCDQGKLTVDDVTIDVPAKEELYPVFLLATGEVTLLP